MDDIKKCNVCERTFSSEADFFQNTSRWRVCSEENLWFNCACGSTLFLKKGRYPWYAFDKTLSVDAKSIFDKMREKESLPHISSAVFLLEEKLQDGNSEPADIAKILRLEPLLLSEVIKMAGRLKKAQSQDNVPINSLIHALAYMGKKALSDMVLVASLKMVKVTTTDFSVEDFWQASFITALLAQKICKKYATYLSEDEAYLAGFLCNIGKIVSAFHYPQEIDALTRILRNPARATDWLSAEKDAHFHDHRILGEIACAFWGLPVFVLESVMKHHDAIPSNSLSVELFEVVGLANQLMHWVRLEPQRIDRKVLDILSARFRLTEADLEQLTTGLPTGQ